jgi:RNA polymerase sigma-70 factor (ECF subfamily)
VTLDNERDVIIDWKKGNKKAYEKLVRHYMRDAFLVAYGLTGNAEDARDLSQEAFIKAYQSRDRFDEARPFYPWLYRILKNHCLNLIKRGMRYTSPLKYEDNPDRERFASPQSTPLEQLEREERKRFVRAAIDMLSEDHREIIVLKNFKGHAYQEIADILEIPIGTVMSRLYYARKALKDIIEQLEAEGLPQPEPTLANGNPEPGEVF